MRRAACASCSGWRRRAEHHRDRLDPGLDQGPGAALDLLRVQAALDATVRARSLGDFEAQVARHERLRLGDLEVVQLVLALAADLERVAEARRRDEARERALALDQRVGEERGRVDHAGEVLGRQPSLAEQRADTRRHGARRVLVGGEDLATPLAPAIVIVDHDVGEGAADVGPEAHRFDQIHGIGC